MRKIISKISRVPTSNYLSLLLWAILAFLVIYPLSFLVAESFTIIDIDAWGIGNYLEFFTDTFYVSVLGRTFLLSTLVLIVTTIVGIPLAYILARYDLRGKFIFMALSLLPMVLPAYAGAFAYIKFFGSRGVLNTFLMDLGLVDFANPINFIYGLHGVVFVISLRVLPFIVLSVTAGLSSVDPSLEEAAETSGASAFRRLRQISLPLATPAYLTGAVLTFLWPFTDWLTPMILGEQNFLPSVAYNNIAYHFSDPHRRAMGIVAIIVSTLVCVLLFMVAQKWVDRKKYTSLGKGTTLSGMVIDPGPVMKTISYLYMSVIAILVLIVPITLGIAAFTRRWVMEVVPSTWTIQNYADIIHGSFFMIRNSFVFTGVALALGVVFGLVLAYLVSRTRAIGRKGLDALTTGMLALPGIAIGAGMLRAFWTGIPLARFWIIMPLALFVRRLPYFSRVARSSYQQLEPSLEESSLVAGAGKFRTFFKISLPLLLKGVFVGTIMFFIMALQEISTAVFLYRSGWQTLPVGIYLNWHRGMEFGYAAAMAFMLVMIALILLLIASRIGGGVMKVAWGGRGT